MKKFIKNSLSILLLCSLIIGLTGCNSNNKKQTTKTTDSTSVEKKAKSEKLTVGLLPAESAIPIILAQEKGFFKEKAEARNQEE